MKDSVIMVVAGGLTSTFNYLYLIAMGVLLTPEQYGILFGLVSMLTIITLFPRSLNLIITRQTSNLLGRGKTNAIYHFWRSSLNRAILVGVLTFVILSALSLPISWFLHIDNVFYPVILFSGILLAFGLQVNWGVTRGLQRFLPLGLGIAFWAFLRFAFGVLLVLLGFGLFGGLIAIPLSYLVAFLLSIFFLRRLAGPRTDEPRISNLGGYTIFTFLSIFSITMLTHFDVVLVRHYFSPVDAGIYSGIAVLGRVVYYAPMGIAGAIFPKTAEAQGTGAQHWPLFLKSMLMVLTIVGALCLIYALVPDLIFRLLFSDQYKLSGFILLKYASAMALFAMTFLAVNYLLSLGRARIAFALSFTLLLQLGLISIYHAELEQVVNVMLICGIVAFTLTIIFLRVTHSDLVGRRQPALHT